MSSGAPETVRLDSPRLETPTTGAGSWESDTTDLSGLRTRGCVPPRSPPGEVRHTDLQGGGSSSGASTRAGMSATDSLATYTRGAREHDGEHHHGDHHALGHDPERHGHHSTWAKPKGGGGSVELRQQGPPTV